MCNEEKKELELPGLLSSASILARRVKGFSESKELYIRIFLRNGDELYVSRWAGWEDEHTGEKLIFLEGDNRCLLTDFRNVEEIEFLYEKPESKAIGFEGPIEWPPAWLKWGKKNNKPAQGK